MNDPRFELRGQCPRCGGFIFNEVVFCPYCGADLRGPKELPRGLKLFLAFLKCLGFFAAFILIQSIVSAVYMRLMYVIADETVLKSEEALYNFYMSYVHYASAFAGVATVGAYWVIYSAGGKSFTKKINLKSLSPAKCTGMAVYGMSVQIIISVGLSIFYLLFPSLSSHSNSESIGQMLEAGSLISRILNVAVVTGITEEIVFRGLIYNTLKGVMPRGVAIIASSLIFGIAHMNPEQTFYTTVLGILLCLVYEKCGTIIAPMIVHVSFNGTNFIFLYINFSNSAAYLALFLISLGAALITTAFLFFTQKKSLNRL
ncbi:MAG: CPBP family intramembrane metalloprotease [Clostridia bacterium]|nr:CPBP family intramembrane metalloprotease [Clostridia bacterium]